MSGENVSGGGGPGLTRTGEATIEVRLTDGALYFTLTEEGAVLTRCQGRTARVKAPEAVQGQPVTRIGKKAFLGCKRLRQIWLPETLEEIGDWAFANCSALERVILPRRPIRFGKSVFLECAGLVSVSDYEDALPSRLLAAAVREMDAAYLLDTMEAGSQEWLKKWDARLEAILSAPDQEGYSRQVLCGEEDYASTDMEAYINRSRKRKVRLALLRCLHAQGLSAELEKELRGYLLAHTKGRESEETWQVLLEEHGERREYYSLFAELGCLNEENLSGILSDIGENYPEMKAYFLRRMEETGGGQDFFTDLLSL